MTSSQHPETWSVCWRAATVLLALSACTRGDSSDGAAVEGTTEYESGVHRFMPKGGFVPDSTTAVTRRPHSPCQPRTVKAAAVDYVFSAELTACRRRVAGFALTVQVAEGARWIPPLVRVIVDSHDVLLSSSHRRPTPP